MAIVFCVSNQRFGTMALAWKRAVIVYIILCGKVVEFSRDHFSLSNAVAAVDN